MSPEPSAVMEFQRAMLLEAVAVMEQYQVDRMQHGRRVMELCRLAAAAVVEQP